MGDCRGEATGVTGAEAGGRFADAALLLLRRWRGEGLVEMEGWVCGREVEGSERKRGKGESGQISGKLLTEVKP